MHCCRQTLWHKAEGYTRSACESTQKQWSNCNRHWSFRQTKLNVWPPFYSSPTRRSLWRATRRKEMRRKKKEANYSLTAGWPETNLIIIIVKKAQRKPAASLLPPQSNRKAFSLRNDLQSDKSNRFTVTGWKGPAPTLLELTWPNLLTPAPGPLPPPVCSLGQRRMRLAQKRQATSLFISPLAQHEPPSNRRESSALWNLVT